MLRLRLQIVLVRSWAARSATSGVSRCASTAFGGGAKRELDRAIVNRGLSVGSGGHEVAAPPPKTWLSLHSPRTLGRGRLLLTSPRRADVRALVTDLGLLEISRPRDRELRASPPFRPGNRRSRTRPPPAARRLRIGSAVSGESSELPRTTSEEFGALLAGIPAAGSSLPGYSLWSAGRRDSAPDHRVDRDRANNTIGDLRRSSKTLKSVGDCRPDGDRDDSATNGSSVTRLRAAPRRQDAGWTKPQSRSYPALMTARAS